MKSRETYRERASRSLIKSLHEIKSYKRDIKILDLGCGKAPFAYLCKKLGFKN